MTRHAVLTPNEPRAVRTDGTPAPVVVFSPHLKELVDRHVAQPPPVAPPKPATASRPRSEPYGYD